MDVNLAEELSSIFTICGILSGVVDAADVSPTCVAPVLALAVDFLVLLNPGFGPGFFLVFFAVLVSVLALLVAAFLPPDFLLLF